MTGKTIFEMFFFETFFFEIFFSYFFNQNFVSKILFLGSSDIIEHVSIEKKSKIQNKFLAIFGGWSRDHITPNISGWGRKFKNRYSAAICILTRHPDLKYEPNRSRGLGCRGGATDFVTAHLVIWFHL